MLNTDKMRTIARRIEVHRKGDLLRADFPPDVCKPHQTVAMGIPARHDAAPTGGALRRGAEMVGEEYTLGGEAIYRRRLDVRPHTTHVPAQVVTYHKQYIGACALEVSRL